MQRAGRVGKVEGGLGGEEGKRTRRFGVFFVFCFSFSCLCVFSPFGLTSEVFDVRSIGIAGITSP